MLDVDERIRDELIQLTQEWIAAIADRDASALNRIIANDFLISGWLLEGRLADKQFYIADCLQPVEIKGASYSFDEWRIRVYGEAAVVNCRFECQASVAGQPWGGSFLFTDVWVKKGGNWQAVMRHTSPVVKGDANHG
jgi:ketosteroid isomerase-like protein